MSMNPEIFSAWCVRCLENDGKDHTAHMAEERNRRGREARNSRSGLKIVHPAKEEQ